MVSYTIRRGCRLEALYDGDVGLAAALAHGLQAVATTGALELGEEGGHEPCPRGPEGVAERDGAAVDVHLREVDVELALPCEDDRRERLVDLHEIDVVHRHPRLLDGVARGGDGRREHVDGIFGPDAPVVYARPRGERAAGRRVG